MAAVSGGPPAAARSNRCLGAFSGRCGMAATRGRRWRRRRGPPGGGKRLGNEACAAELRFADEPPLLLLEDDGGGDHDWGRGIRLSCRRTTDVEVPDDGPTDAEGSRPFLLARFPPATAATMEADAGVRGEAF